MQNKFLWLLVVVLASAGSFYGGVQYAHKKSPSLADVQTMTPEQRQQLFSQFRGQGSGQAGGRRPFGGGGFSSGQILSKDDKSITIKLVGNAGSKIVFLSDVTSIGKAVPGKASDLAVGQAVVVTGTPNSDGSVTAQTIQIRPEGQDAFPALR